MSLRERLFATVVVLLCLSAAVSAQPAPAADPEPAKAFDVHVDAHIDVTTFAGFVPERRVLPRGWLSATARADLARWVPWRGASLFAQYYAFEGTNGSQILGDYQGFSNLDADAFAHIGELSVDWQVTSGLRTRVGRLDANSDFALPMSTELFHHPSAGLSGAIFPMPTYPNPELGTLVAWQLPGSLHALSATGGVYFGPEPADLPDRMLAPGRMWVGQVAAGGEGTPGRAAAGVWRHTGRFIADHGSSAPSDGWFARGEHVVGHFAGTHEFVVSLQFSQSTTHVAPVRHHTAAGLRLQRATRHRQRDAMGLRLSFAELTGDCRAADAPDEIGLELFHYFWLNGWLAVQPDLQFIRLPATSSDRDRLAFTLRLHLNR